MQYPYEPTNRFPGCFAKIVRILQLIGQETDRHYNEYISTI